MTRHDQHPWWCARNHNCTAPNGPHRSTPVILDTDAYRLIATRLLSGAGGDQLELRVVVDLPADTTRARQRARELVLAVCIALTPRRFARRRSS